jgi:hypothetical protein
MKYITLLFLFISSIAFAQDQTPIVINIRDSPKLQFNGAFVKQKATVLDYRPVINSTKDFYISVQIKYYENNAGAYGAEIIATIRNDGTLTAEEKAQLYHIYGDKIIDYQTTNKWVDVSGNVVAQGTPGAITELAYWQGFKLNQVAGMGTLSTQGAVDAQYLIITAIINKLNARKNW